MDPPLPILVGSNSVRLKFVSDNKEHGTGFSMMYQAIKPATLPGEYEYSLSIYSGQIKLILFICIYLLKNLLHAEIAQEPQVYGWCLRLKA